MGRRGLTARSPARRRHAAIVLYGQPEDIARVSQTLPPASAPTPSKTAGARPGTGSLAGKVAIVTGASAGVGLATAQKLAAEGCRLVLAARSPAPLRAVADSLGAVAVPADVSRIEDLRRILAETERAYGRLDILVNNAGANRRGRLGDIDGEGVATIIGTNLTAPIQLTQLALPLLRGSRGVVVNIASMAGHVALPGEVTYCASKWGLRGFSFALAEELRGTGVGVCVVSPGPVATGFVLDDVAHTPDLVFSQPFLSAEAVAAAVLACIRDRRAERAMPRVTVALARLLGAMPTLQAALRPVLEKQGARRKARYRASGNLR